MVVTKKDNSGKSLWGKYMKLLVLAWPGPVGSICKDNTSKSAKRNCWKPQVLTSQGVGNWALQPWPPIQAPRLVGRTLSV